MGLDGEPLAPTHEMETWTLHSRATASRIGASLHRRFFLLVVVFLMRQILSFRLGLLDKMRRLLSFSAWGKDHVAYLPLWTVGYANFDLLPRGTLNLDTLVHLLPIT